MPIPIITYPNPVLEKVSEEIDEITPELCKLAEDMLEAMNGQNGLGLAAPQVGINKRLIVVDVDKIDPGHGCFMLVNPQIVREEGVLSSDEGCLSFPELTVTLTRAKKVTVKAKNLSGEEVTIPAEGLLAVCFQHEIDHLDGHVIIDKASYLKRTMYDRKVRKWKERAKTN